MSSSPAVLGRRLTTTIRPRTRNKKRNYGFGNNRRFPSAGYSTNGSHIPRPTSPKIDTSPQCLNIRYIFKYPLRRGVSSLNMIFDLLDHYLKLWIWKGYEQIRSSSGLLTPALDHETISGISLDRLMTISASILDGSFRFSPMRQIFVPAAAVQWQTTFNYPVPYR